MSADTKKERILEIAEKEIARYGFRKTTMDDIAGKARMGKSTLYYYFKSKEDIFAEIIRRDSNTFKRKLNQAVDSAGTPQDKLRMYVFTRMKHLKELTNLYTTLTEEYLEHHVFIEKTRKEFNEYEIDILRRLLQEGIQGGIFVVEDIDISARMIAIALKGLEYILFVKETDRDMENESKQMLQILFKGIEGR